MNVPFFGNLNIVEEEPVFGMDAATFLSDPSLCRYDCQVCPYRGRLKGGFMDFDAFCLQASKMKLMGAELFIVRGGEPTGIISDIEEALIFLKSMLPLRVHTSGIRTPAVERLKSLCDGFCLDIKYPLKANYDINEKEEFARIIPGSSCPYSYRDALRETIGIVDRMPQTYFTCTQSGASTFLNVAGSLSLKLADPEADDPIDQYFKS